MKETYRKELIKLKPDLDLRLFPLSRKMSHHTFEGGKVFESITPTYPGRPHEALPELGYGNLYPSEKDIGVDVISYVQLTEAPKADIKPPNRKQRRQEARKKT